MTVPANSAVFLSYASQDAEAARRICEALRAGGIEVWFDQSELRGGDAWDRSIRQQIHDCRLFMPVISAASESRDEGYFRREWKLAVDRTHDMADKRAFLVPLVIDGTPERGASVPEKFHELQWTRLPGGETPPAFVERVQRLLSPETFPLDQAQGATEPAPTTKGRHPSTSRPKGVPTVTVGGVIGAVLLVVLGYFGIDRLRGSKQTVQGQSIAVLPLTNESGDASQQYFSDGISEDLITALGQFPGLTVIGRTSSFQFRDSKEDSRSIGAKLGVAHLLEGSVRKAGDMIRVSTELIDTTNGTMQWSERYDRPYKDLFALQDEITHAVAEALKAKLLPGGQVATQSERPPSGNLEAYNAYLQGQFYYSRNTEADLRKAIELYTQATALDPHYALAWSRLSGAWLVLGAEFLEGAPARESYENARAAADRALSISPDLADAHIARGFVLRAQDFDWRGAESEFRRASELAPNDGAAKFSLGRQLAAFGEVEQAIVLTQQALATEPLRANWYNWLAGYYSALNRLDEAERAIRRAIELQPGAVALRSTLAVIEIQRGHAQEALAAAQQETPSGGWQEIALALASQIGGDRRAADEALKTAIDTQANRAPYQIAEIHALRGDAKETFAWLDRAWSTRDPGIESVLYDPFIRRYKDDPRFAAYCKKVGLPTPAEVAARKKPTGT